MPENIGPHLLGRKPNVPDDRDWTPDKLHAELRKTSSTFDPSETIDQASSRLLTWREVLAFASMLWAWIKHKPTPTPVPTPTPTNLWADLVVLDQGDFGTCVGNAGAGWLASEPVVDPGVTEALARQLYFEATCYDGMCDPTGQTGSTSRSLAKALKARGRLLAYAFATSMADIDEWLAGHGPVMVGADWTNDMFNPGPDHVVHITGGVAGGHEWLVRYREPDTTQYRCRNSWGTGWGDHGDFLIEAADLGQLLFKQGGDALLAAELPL